MARNTGAAAPGVPARRPPIRMTQSGSFHAGAPFPSLGSYSSRRNSATNRGSFLREGPRRPSTHQYHTFPTPPPKTPSEGPADLLAAAGRQSRRRNDDDENDSDDDDSDSSSTYEQTPLPWKQLCLLAVLSLAEQTALNSISPYLPKMVGSFHEIPEWQNGLYVGLLASAFAMAQLTTNLLWGYLSDMVGRKPTMLLGTALLAGCFVFFGFCRNYAQLLSVHIAMGLLNGNAAVVPTALGELTDRSNQSRAFTWLPVMYSLGGITGPALGGLLVGYVNRETYPFLWPNLVSAALLALSVIILAIWFDETLDSSNKKPFTAVLAPIQNLFGRWFGPKNRGRQGSWSSRWPTRAGQNQAGANGDSDDDALSDDEYNEGTGAGESQGLLGSHDGRNNSDGEDVKTGQKQGSAWKQLTNRTTLTVLFTYLVFQLANISYNSLYPIFASAPEPTGRALGPQTIGLSLSFSGLATILFQVTVFQPLKAKIGNLGTYRLALLGLAISMAVMPFIGYVHDNPYFGLGTGKMWVYAELGLVLLLKNACAVGGLSSAMLLVSSARTSNMRTGKGQCANIYIYILL